MADADDKLVECYTDLLRSFMQGTFRLYGSRIAVLATSLAIVTLHRLPAEGIGDHPHAESLRFLMRVKRSDFDSYTYLSKITELIYLTTLIDTFLSDTTKFLFLLHPGSIGDNQPVPLSALLSPLSKSQLVTQAATKRVRDLSYSSFLERVQFLRDRFGLTLRIDQETRDALGHYSGVRNVVIHDQGVFDTTLDETSQLQVSQKTCALHPTPVTFHDIDSAHKAYVITIKIVAKAVVSQVLGANPSHEIFSLIEGIPLPEDQADQDLLEQLDHT